MASLKLSLASLLLVTPLALSCGSDDDANTNNNSSNNNTANNNGGLDARITCSGDNCIVPADFAPYTESMTWTKDKTWILDPNGQAVVNVTIGAGATLTIEAGTTIKAAGQLALVVDKGAKIEAVGTASEPIVFTSAKAEGTRNPGDWGGIIINGYAPTSCDPCEGEGGSGAYGGDDPTDNSGTLEYVRIAFGGNQITDEDQYNGLALQGVGSGTSIDWLHLHKPADDGIEFFGGAVSAKHVIVTGADDDSIDWVFGWQGNMQHVLVQQDSGGDRGIEADSNSSSPNKDPRSSPVISNLTICGNATSQGILLRRGTAVKLWNTVVVGSLECLDVDGIPETFDQLTGGGIALENVYLDCSAGFKVNDEQDDMMNAVNDADSNGDVDLAAVVSAMTNVQQADPGIACGTVSSPDWMPSAGAAVLSGGVAPAGVWFDAVDYVGGMHPGDDWTTWTAFPAN